MYADNKDAGEYVHLHMLAWAFFARQYDKYQNVTWLIIFKIYYYCLNLWPLMQDDSSCL